MLSSSKHDPEHRTLPASDTTIAASAVMLRQAQHDGTGTLLGPTLSLTTRSGDGTSNPPSHTPCGGRSLSTRRGQGTPNPRSLNAGSDLSLSTCSGDGTPNPTAMPSRRVP
ncbi:MAG: hypothetical protein AMXMBFR61_14130 [Fimbriimonadales bacterium]